MKNIYHKKIWCTGSVQIYTELSLIPIIKSMVVLKTQMDYVTIKLLSYPTLERLDIYELKMALFDN